MAPLDGTSVRTLRLRGDFARTPAAKLAATAVLSQADLSPSDLPPSSILVLRSVTEALPRGWRPSVPSARPSATWYRGIQGRMRAARDRAARPQGGRLPPDPEAVLFADEAELLACWWLDVAAGRAGERWFWSAIFGARTFTAEVLARRLAERAMYVPQTVALLSAWQQLPEASRAISGPMARRIAAATSRAYGLPRVARALETSPWLPALEAVEALAWPSAPMPALAPALTVLGGGWSAPPSVALDDGFVALVDLARVLDAPRAMSEAAVAQVILRRVSPRRAPSSVPGSSAPAPSTRVDEAPQPPRRAAQVDRARPRRPADDRPKAEAAPDFAHPEEATQPAEHGMARQDAGHRASAPGPRLEARSEAAAPLRTPAVTSHETASTLPPPDRAQHTDPAASDAPAAVASFPASPYLGTTETAMGGAFYLINALERLDLDAAFSAWRLHEQLGAWAVLDGVARGALVVADRFTPDPLWAVLAELAGRDPSSTLGEGLVPPHVSGLPPAWAPHEAAARDLVEQVEAAPLEDAVAPPFARWLRLALPFVLHRLRSALEAAHLDEVTSALSCPARLEVTRSHVDVVFSLESISLPVRRAGLDKNPGWLAAYRRVVTFHFV